VAKLLGIAIKPRPKEEMLLCEQALLEVDHGLVGDCCGKPGKRQITLLNLDDWQAACADLGVELPWHTRRANLLVDHLPLYQRIGSRIQLGDALLEITGETDPCERMEQAQAGLLQALLPEWRGGVTCRVLEGGAIRLGMAVEILAPEI
jgi:MOSC domain-containing protein YiiM